MMAVVSLTLPGLREGDLVTIASSVADEAVLALTVGVSARGPRLCVAPIEIAALARRSRKPN